MDSTYTTTITDEARKRGIKVEVIDPATPIFVLKYKGKKVRCYNSLTDRVGAVTFHLTQNKHLANSFLRRHGFPVPDQMLYTTFKQALDFLSLHGCVVVKPCSQWGARGVSTHIKTPDELRVALRAACRYEDSVVIEETVTGEDRRLIFVDYCFVAAIQRNHAFVQGNGKDTIRTLIRRKNRISKHADPANVVPFDRETRRCINALGYDHDTVLLNGKRVKVRRTSNFHTGGTVDVITDSVSPDLIAVAKKITRLTELPVVGIDFLVNDKTGDFKVIELAPDLAISPRGGAPVARRFLDYLFPDSKINK